MTNFTLIITFNIFTLVLACSFHIHSGVIVHVSCADEEYILFLPGLKEGNVLIWEKDTFVRVLSF